jgi:hypothetical protein
LLGEARGAQTGFLWASSFLGRSLSFAVADDDEKGVRSEPYDAHETNGGPGPMVTFYLPKNRLCTDTVDTLSPSDARAAVTAPSETMHGKGNGQSDVLPRLLLVVVLVLVALLLQLLL